MGKRSKGELTNAQPKSKRNKNEHNENELKNNSTVSGKSKKIVFDEDGNPEPQIKDVATNVTQKKQEKSNNKKSKTKNITQSNIGSNSESTQSMEQTNQGEEDEIKEEDIDRFCDEIEEEDNEQYENWVKLIEAKLTSNKKKS